MHNNAHPSKTKQTAANPNKQNKQNQTKPIKPNRNQTKLNNTKQTPNKLKQNHRSSQIYVLSIKCFLICKPPLPPHLHPPFPLPHPLPSPHPSRIPHHPHPTPTHHPPPTTQPHPPTLPEKGLHRGEHHNSERIRGHGAEVTHSSCLPQAVK